MTCINVSEDDSDDSLSILSFKTHLPSSSHHGMRVPSSKVPFHIINWVYPNSKSRRLIGIINCKKDINTSLVWDQPRSLEDQVPPPIFPQFYLIVNPTSMGIPGVGLVRANLCDGRVPLMRHDLTSKNQIKPSHEGAFGRTIELQVDREKAKA